MLSYRCFAVPYLMLLVISLPGQAQEAQQEMLLIQDVSIVDVESGEIKPGMSILIEGDSIKHVAEKIALKDGDGITKVSAQGKFAIPGLWDMHIHWYDVRTMPLFPINGVTGVRVMWGNPLHHSWKKQFAEGRRYGPRMYIASAIVDGPNPIWNGSWVVDSEESATRAVKRAIEMKSDFVKVYSLLSRDSYFAIAEECKAQGIPFAGHVPLTVSAKEASEVGQQSMAHLYEVVLACSSAEEELRQMQTDFLTANDGSTRKYFTNPVRREIARRAFETFDEKKAQALFETMAKNETWQCPTLTVLRNINYLDEPEVRDNPYLKYFSPGMRTMLTPPASSRRRSAARTEFDRARLELEKQLLVKMYEAGVPIIAGTDVLNPFCLPGFSLHTELELMVEAGIDPLGVLRSATLMPAKFMGREDELGTIAAGKLADMVLLNDNPLEDIKHTRNIHAVISRGQLKQRDELDRLLAEFEESGKQKNDQKK